MRLAPTQQSLGLLLGLSVPRGNLRKPGRMALEEGSFMAVCWVFREGGRWYHESSPGDQHPQARHKWLQVTQMQGI